MIGETTIKEIVNQIFTEVWGKPIAPEDADRSFLELGFDAHMLTAASIKLNHELGVRVHFRSLMEVHFTFNALVAHLDEELSAGILSHQLADQPTNQSAQSSALFSSRLPTSEAQTFRQLMEQQLQLMTQQLQILNQLQLEDQEHPQASASAAELPLAPDYGSEMPAPDFGDWQPVEMGEDGALTSAQKERLRDIVAQFSSQTATSKKAARSFRRILADPAQIGVFDSRWKEAIYPLIIKQANGAYIWDMDDHRYVDISMGGGAHLFGHSPHFLNKALKWQMEHSLSTGTLSPLATEVARFTLELSGMERTALFDNEGEAIQAAIRLARIATQRESIVTFAGAPHHGVEALQGVATVEEGRLGTMPAFSGIASNEVKSSYILRYGAAESLDFIKEQADELAAVVVEPLPSASPQHLSRDFIKKLRQITANAGIPLIFDETISGFRMHPGGMQAAWQLKPDMACFGSVASSGFPIGIVAGSAAYLENYDGGGWHYGDDSQPKTPAGWRQPRSGRHPMSLAAARATLRHLQRDGETLLPQLNQRTERFVSEMNRFFSQRQLPMRLSGFGSTFRLEMPAELTLAPMLAHHLLLRRVYAPTIDQLFFFSTEHDDEAIAIVANAIKESVVAMQQAGFLPATKADRQIDIEPFATTIQQEMAWLATQISPAAAAAFNEGWMAQIVGKLDVPAMESAIQTAIKRHEALQLRFSLDGATQQRALFTHVQIPIVDLSDDPDPEKTFEEFVAKEAAIPLNLAHGPVIQAKIVKLADNQFGVTLVGHQIVFDSASANRLWAEILALYEAEHRGEPSQLPTANSFKKYLAARQAAAVSEEKAAYWTNLFAEETAHLDLPADRPRPAVRSFAGRTLDNALSPELSASLSKLAADSDRDLADLIFAIYALLIYELSDQSEFAIVEPIQVGDEAALPIGATHSIVPVRVALTPQADFGEFWQAISQQRDSAAAHVPFSAARLVEALKLKRGQERHPITDIAFQSLPAAESNQFAGIVAALYPIISSYCRHDLFLTVQSEEETLNLFFNYNQDIFDQDRIEGWVDRFEALSQAVSSDPNQSLAVLTGKAVADEAQQEDIELAETKVEDIAGKTDDQNQLEEPHVAADSTSELVEHDEVETEDQDSEEGADTGSEEDSKVGFEEAAEEIVASDEKEEETNEFQLELLPDTGGFANGSFELPEKSSEGEIEEQLSIIHPVEPTEMPSQLEETVIGASPFSEKGIALEAETNNDSPEEEDMNEAEELMEDLPPQIDSSILEEELLIEEQLFGDHLATADFSDLPGLGDEEIAEIASLPATMTPVALPPEMSAPSATLDQRFSQMAEKTPDQVGVVYGSRQYSYAEIDKRSNKLAHYLSELGVASGQLVGVYMSRSLDAVIALLGVLKAGGAFLPLDPSDPQERTAFMIDESEIPLAITQKSLQDNLPDNAPMFICIDTAWEAIEKQLDEPLNREAAPDEPAYLVYVSGSHGKPLGIMVSHQSAINLLDSLQKLFAINEDDVALNLFNVAKDKAVAELFLPLINGGRVVILPEMIVSDGRNLAKSIRHYEATILHAPPHIWQMLLKTGWQGYPGLKMLCSGDILSRELADRLLEKAGESLWYLYGESEGTIWSTAAQIFSDDNPITIGHPLNNMEALLLDDNGEIAPEGVAAELAIGGDGLAIGYPFQPDLEAERFVHLSSTDQTVVRTGAMATKNPDGSFTILGRLDDRTTIRANRVELAEIEQFLLAQDSVAEAAVLARDVAGNEADDADKQLTAYIVPASPQNVPDVTELALRMELHLPAYMMPANIIILEQLPKNEQGEIDAYALPATTPAKKEEAPKTKMMPQSEVEKAIAEIWASTLNRDDIGIEEDFFELGGNSDLAMQILTQLKERFHMEITLNAFFEKPQIKALAEQIEAMRWLAFAPTQPIGDDREEIAL